MTVTKTARSSMCRPLSKLSTLSSLLSCRERGSICAKHLPEEGRENRGCCKKDSDSDAKANVWNRWDQTWWRLTGQWFFSTSLFLLSWGQGTRKREGTTAPEWVLILYLGSEWTLPTQVLTHFSCCQITYEWIVPLDAPENPQDKAEVRTVQ